MRKTAIFEDVVSIMTQDSATKKDIVGADPTGFRECISDDMSEKDFLYQVQTYLASFGVIGHVAFREKYGMKGIPIFSQMRRDCLELAPPKELLLVLLAKKGIVIYAPLHKFLVEEQFLQRNLYPPMTNECCIMYMY